MSRPYESASAKSEEQYLRELGYKQVLDRRMGGFGNFAISFSVISVISGCMQLFGFGLTTGGPAVMMWGWVLVGAMVLTIGASLAEVTSAYPTSGGLYYMADRLGGKAAGWYTGWLNLLGLLGGIASIDFGAATFVSAFAQIQWDLTPAPGRTFALFAAILLLHVLINLTGIRITTILNSISVWWHLFGVLIIVFLLAVIPAHHRSPGFVFAHTVNGTGWHNNLYVACLGLLLAQYTFCGYDASAHLSEETTNARREAARGIVRSIWVSWIAGFALLAGLLFALQDYTGTVGSSTGVPPAQIFLDALGATGAKLLLLVVIAAMLFCGNAETAATARMIFAFSRDGALPGSGFWHHVSPRTKTPTRAVWLGCTVAAVLALPALWSTTAYGAVTAINVLGMTPAYIIPVILRRRAGRRFQAGPWSLGRWSAPINIIAICWVVVVTVLFCLPQSSPVTPKSFNYAPIALAAALLLAVVMWLVTGRRTYALPAAKAEDPMAVEEVV
ncbi:amino acid permease [Mangrovactinospora gilvigrisea]|uniref:Amino acid permease n=1 Tax=Mangrovactinospora gilvigrisea TaxID=1428644 RepID=A0A1J7CBC7_9ACTN|nr:amino acid permease [Mangrovactinospora gilvigrisea]OIV36954.1 amino acid permease [Mangrovactinospora gilvigrisea]